jgi:hypothetical protein
MASSASGSLQRPRGAFFGGCKTSRRGFARSCVAQKLMAKEKRPDKGDRSALRRIGASRRRSCSHSCTSVRHALARQGWSRLRLLHGRRRRYLISKWALASEAPLNPLVRGSSPRWPTKRHKGLAVTLPLSHFPRQIPTLPASCKLQNAGLARAYRQLVPRYSPRSIAQCIDAVAPH